MSEKNKRMIAKIIVIALIVSLVGTSVFGALMLWVQLEKIGGQQ